jgi:hypothetical protein
VFGSQAARAGSRAGPSRAEQAFMLVRITSQAEPARYLSEPDRAEPSRLVILP